MKKHLIMKTAVILLVLPILLALAACDTSSSGGNDTAEPAQPKEPAMYVIVRSDNGSKEETDGAVRLRKYIRETMGIEIELETDWVKRGENVEDHRFAHEILFGDTNRAESVDAYAALHQNTPDMVDYALSSNENHYVIAASAGYVDDAVTQFITYLEANPDLLHKAPITISDSRVHDFPLDDITVMGKSISEYGAIVHPISYNNQLIGDVRDIADLIYQATGNVLPVYNERDKNVPTDKPVIRIGARTDEALLNAGSFSYALDFSEDGITIDSRDNYCDTRGIGDLMTLLQDGVGAGGVLALDDSHDVRIENPADTPRIEICAWGVGGTQMTEEYQFAEVKECGFNLVILIKPEEDLLHNYCKWLAKYELKALWHDGDFYMHDYRFESETPLADSFKVTDDSFAHSDITWGHMLRDEPNAAMFDLLAEAYDLYDAQTDDKVPYINLFPSYANEQQLGTPTYEEHLKQFFDKVDPALYTSVDIYPLNIASGINNDYFYNLDVFATECRTRGIPFAVYIQSVSFNANKRSPDEQEMRWQAYCALSFGAQNIEYFTYRTPDSETEAFKNALIDRENQKTDRWYGAQSVNRALALMSDAFMQYDNLGAYVVNEDKSRKFMHFANQYKNFDAISEVRTAGDKPVLIGAFASDTAEYDRAFTCVNLGDPGIVTEPLEVTVTLTEATTAVMYYRDTVTTLTPDANGNITFTLGHGDGAFITLGKN